MIEYRLCEHCRGEGVCPWPEGPSYDGCVWGCREGVCGQCFGVGFVLVAVVPAVVVTPAVAVVEERNPFDLKRKR